MEMNFSKSKAFFHVLKSLTFYINRNLLYTSRENVLENWSIFAIKSNKSCVIISIFQSINQYGDLFSLINMDKIYTVQHSMKKNKSKHRQVTLE